MMVINKVIIYLDQGLKVKAKISNKATPELPFSISEFNYIKSQIENPKEVKKDKPEKNSTKNVTKVEAKAKTVKSKKQASKKSPQPFKQDRDRSISLKKSKTQFDSK